MTQPAQSGFSHGANQSKTAGTQVLTAHGSIDKEIKGILATIEDVKGRGWTKGAAAAKFYRVAHEMVDDAQIIQKKLFEIHEKLYGVNREVTQAAQNMHSEIDRLQKSYKL